MTNNLTKYDISALSKEFELFLRQKYQSQNESFPLSILSEKLSPFETVVKYLIENLNKNYSDAGRLLKKDRQVIWITYKRTKRKLPLEFNKIDYTLAMPLEKLSSEKFSISELIASYIKLEKGMKNSQIAGIMKRDSRTIWTLCKRFESKKHGTRKSRK